MAEHRLHRIIIEMGMGTDLHGMDYTKAAARAIEDALRHTSLPLFAVTKMSRDDMDVRVTIGVQVPEACDGAALADKLPYGKTTVSVQRGGLNVVSGKETIVVAQASIEVFLPKQASL
ncbi:MAG: Lin0512 family protein [Pseudomonadota bacterium]